MASSSTAASLFSYLVAAFLLLSLTAYPVRSQTVADHFTFDVTVYAAAQGPDATGNGNSGPTIVSTKPTAKFGNGSAVNTQPSEYGNIIITYNRASSWSIAFWVYTLSSVTSKTIVLQPDDDGEFVFQITSQQYMQFQYGSGTLVTFNDYAIPVNTWTHFAVTGDTSTKTLITEYVNGKSVADYTVTAITPPGATDYDALQFGGYNQDELWFFNSALNATQVATLYASNTV